MECAVCGSPDSSSIRLQPDMIALLQDHPKIKFETEPSNLEVCTTCCSQLLSWSVFNDQFNSSMSPFSLPSITPEEEIDIKEEPLSPPSHHYSDIEDSDTKPFGVTDTGEPDPSIFFPEVKLEVQDEVEVPNETCQTLPLSCLQTKLLTHATDALPLYVTNTKANNPANYYQPENKVTSNVNTASKKRELKDLDPKKHYCNTCDKIFNKSSNLKRHMAIHSENRPLFYCSFCRAHFSIRKQLRGHILQKHLDHRRFKCEHCSQCFKRFQHLKRHREIKHNPNKTIYPCEFCGKTFNSIPNKGFHIIRVHAKQLAGGEDEEEEEQKPKGGYSCNVCGKHVKSMDILKRHKLLHLAKKPTFKCKKCGKLLSRKDKLKEHMVTNHSGKDPIKCEVCGKLTPTKTSHRRHMQLHSVDRPLFPCPYCGKFYTSTTSRAYHMIRVHSAADGDMLLPRGQPLPEPRSKDCHICGKTMMHYKSLKGHLLRHAKNDGTSNSTISMQLPTSNTCHICGKTMMHYKSLKAHVMRHEKTVTSTNVSLEDTNQDPLKEICPE